MNEDLNFRTLINGAECPEELKYDFNKNGELRHINTNEPFLFNYKYSHDSNYKRYQVLGHLITQYIYELLEKACKLKRICIPKHAAANEHSSFFFTSENAFTTCSTLVVLLQDQGNFRAGQWGRRTIVHEGLQHGSQVPFITMALAYSWKVVVLNPNDNVIHVKIEEECLSHSVKEESTCMSQLVQTITIPKKYSGSPEEHTTYVWDHFISKSAAERVAFIAHGYGGLVFVNLLMQRTLEVMNKVYAVAFIDSAHHTLHQTRRNSQVQEWIWKHCRKWVSNSKPLDKPINCLMKEDCPTVSTGTEKYSLAPSSSLQSIFRYLKNKQKIGTKKCLSRSPIVTRSKRKMNNM